MPPWYQYLCSEKLYDGLYQTLLQVWDLNFNIILKPAVDALQHVEGVFWIIFNRNL